MNSTAAKEFAYEESTLTGAEPAPFHTLKTIIEPEIRERDIEPKVIEWSGLTVGQRFYLPFKRLMDIVLSLIGLIVCTPLFLVVAVAIKLDSPGPVFYKQKMREGKDSRPFTMYKFRSMVFNAETMKSGLEALNEMEGPVFKIADDPRTTRVGRFIRKFSIDEAPQFFNVLVGQMSMVGPRPLSYEENSAGSDVQRMKRMCVRPGITCYWQAGGRNRIRSFEQWMDMDMKYIDELGLFTDLKILFKTVPAVFRGYGAS